MRRSPFKTTKTAKKALRKKADTLWSKLVRLRAKNTCEWCGRTGAVNAHHIFGRLTYHMRHNPANGCCLCVRCHVWDSRHSAHQTPELFRQFIIQKKGQDWYDIMQSESLKNIKPDYAMEILYLEQELKKFKED